MDYFKNFRLPFPHKNVLRQIDNFTIWFFLIEKVPHGVRRTFSCVLVVDWVEKVKDSNMLRLESCLSAVLCSASQSRLYCHSLEAVTGHWQDMSTSTTGHRRSAGHLSVMTSSNITLTRSEVVSEQDLTWGNLCSVGSLMMIGTNSTIPGWCVWLIYFVRRLLPICNTPLPPTFSF